MPTSLQPVITVRPGAPMGRSLHNPRRDVAQMLAARTPVHQLPQVLATAFNLCGHAHALAATLALRAAGVEVPLAPGAAECLRRETFLEHLRRMHLDWPRWLALPDATEPRQLAALHGIGASPLRASAENTESFWAQARHWLQVQWLGMPLCDWLDGWDTDPQAWLSAWAHDSRCWPATCLRHALRFDAQLHADHRLLDDSPSPAALAQFCEAVLAQPTLALQPVWQGQCRHTGAWTRGRAARLTASHMLASRLAETVRLALDEVQLAADARSWRAQCGVAGVQMARGRLMHVVQCSSSSFPAGSQVLHYRVIAPTEWNFHPHGVLARAMSALPASSVSAHDTRMRAQVLLAAFDPCVACDLQAWQPSRQEAQPCMN